MEMNKPTIQEHFLSDSRLILYKHLLGCVFLISYSGIAVAESAPNASLIEQGRRIYVEGKLPSGKDLRGIRFGTSEVSGLNAACVNCHRRSGMGSVEGDVQVSPITGNYLFALDNDKHLATMDPRVSKRFNQAHLPYTDATLKVAILQGTNNMGREMHALMPRYKLSNSEFEALTAYLKQLTVQWSPGATGDSIRFAMVITPDVEADKRKVLIDMMRIAFRQKNGSTMTAKHSGTKRQHMVSAAEMVLGTERNWQLDVWELQGAEETWGSQLLEKYQHQPVFALISGTSNSSWQPVHNFCETEQVPCWFPSVDLPVTSPSNYSLYFSRGVNLEADVLSNHLLNTETSNQSLVQIYRDDVVARAAAKSLTHSLAGSAITVTDRTVSSGTDPVVSLRDALSEVKDTDVVMFWLRQDDAAALEQIKPNPTVRYYFSANLADVGRARLSEDWKSVSKLVYLYELPEKREMNLAYFHTWLNIRKLPLVDEALQSEAFFALNYMSDTVSEMLNNMYRDYLVERADSMLNKREGSKSEQETRDRQMLGRPGDMTNKWGNNTVAAELRIRIPEDHGLKSHGTTMYPRLGLGPGQRFASKGGYIVRFEDAKSSKLIAESKWIVP